MAVKRNLSAGRMLAVFEAIAREQPIGVSALARRMAADKSAIQRDLMTLADAGWIRQAPESGGAWEVTPQMMSLAQPPWSSTALRQRARPLLERLRRETGETVYLTIPHAGRFMVLDAMESLQMLRMVPPVGMAVPVEGSATARVFLAALDPVGREAMLERALAPGEVREAAETRARGYAVSAGDIAAGAVAIAAAVTNGDRQPVGALVVTGPSERIDPPRWAAIGELVRDAAAQLSDR